jgi:uncharacterized protein YjdB
MSRVRDLIEAMLKETGPVMDILYPPGLAGAQPRVPAEIYLRTRKDHGGGGSGDLLDILASKLAVNVAPELRELLRNADELPFDSAIDPANLSSAVSSLWKLVFDADPAKSKAAGELVGRPRSVTTAELAAIDQELSNLLQAGGPNTPEYAAKNATRGQMATELANLIRVTGDMVQTATYGFRGIAIEHKLDPTDPAKKALFDETVDTLVQTFWKTAAPVTNQIGGVADTRIPIRWIYQEPLADLYLSNNNKTDLNAIGPPESQLPYWVLANPSREGCARSILAAHELYMSTTDPAQRDRLRGAVSEAVSSLAANDYGMILGPKSQIFYSEDEALKYDPNPVLVAARPFLFLLPAASQVDALLGGDKIFAYAILRAAADMDVVPLPGMPDYAQQAADYYDKWKDTFDFASTDIFNMIAGKNVREAVAMFIKEAANRAGGLLANVLAILLIVVVIVAALLLGALAVAGAPFTGGLSLGLLIPMILIITAAGALYAATAPQFGTVLQPQFWGALYDSVSLEAEQVAHIRRMEPPTRQAAINFWDSKLLKMQGMDLRQEPLCNSYFLEASPARDALKRDLAADRAALAQLQLAFQRAQQNLANNPFSASAQNVFAQALGAVTTFTAIVDYADKVQRTVYRQAPEAVLRLNYFRDLTRDFGRYAVAGRWGNPGGLVTGVAVGSATVTAELLQLRGNVAPTVQVTVVQAQLVSLSLAPASASMAAGTRQQVVATGSFSNGQNLDVTTHCAWSSASPDVATIGRGEIGGVSPGGAGITATLLGRKATTTITVTNAQPVALRVTSTALKFARATWLPVSAVATFSDNTTQDVTARCIWSSAAPGVAAPGSAIAGRILGVAPGTADISATLGGLKASIQVTVTAATLVSCVITPAGPTLVLGAELRLTNTGTFSDGSQQDISDSCTWSADNTNVAAGPATDTVFDPITGMAVIDPKTNLPVPGKPMAGSIQSKIDWFNNHMLPLDLGADGLTASPWTQMDAPDSFPILDRVSTDGDVVTILTALISGSAPPKTQEFADPPPYEYWNGESHYAHYNPYDAKGLPGQQPVFFGNARNQGSEMRLVLARLARLLDEASKPDLVSHVDARNP